MESTLAPTDQDVRITSLTSDLVQFRAEYEAYKRKVADDWAKASDVLIEAAADYGYCDDYDDLIEKVNGIITTGQLKTRERTFTLEYEVTTTITASIEVEVKATSQEAARELFEDCPSDYYDFVQTMMDEIYNGGGDDAEYSMR